MHSDSERAALIAEIKAMLVETLMLPTPVEEMTDDHQLFGPAGLGLDSVDALQLVVALDKRYGVKISDAEVAKLVLASIGAIAQGTLRLRP
jgi:acyl carrier protein